MQTAGEAASAEQLAALFRVDPTLARGLTHGFHSYAGRMHPSTAREGVARFSRAGQRVLDPFCGSGTVLVEAMAAGRVAEGVDASTLAILIAQVRSSPLGAEGRSRLVQTAREIAEESAERARKRMRPHIPSWAAGERNRFFPHVAFELYGLRELIGETPEDDVGRALRACLSSILVKFMRGGEEEGEMRRIGRGVPSRFFSGRAEELARGLEALERRTPARTPVPHCRLGDARSLSHLEDGTFDLVLSSPPYAGTYDYAEHHDVRFLWLGLPREKLDRVQIGSRAVGLGAARQRWIEDRRRWLSEISRVCRPGAAVILEVGDGVVANEPEDAALAIEAEGPRLGLEPVACASQARPPRDMRLREIFGEHPRCEHIVLLRRM